MLKGRGSGWLSFHQVINQDLNFNVTVKLGTPLGAGHLFARRSARPAPNCSAEATSDFASTLTWQGISGVKLGGNAIGYTLSSQSGIDWTQAYAPVPEPAS